MITIKKNEIPQQLKMSTVVLYGAGFAGRQCRKILNEQSIDVEFFVDDDGAKWGKNVEGLVVYSYEDLVKYCNGEEKVNVILTSIYGVQISKKLKKIPNITIYEMYDWYTERVMPERYGEKIYSDEELKAYKENVEKLIPHLSDKESVEVLENLYQYMISGNIDYISKISSSEEQYFIKQVLEYFGEKEISLVDAGAYEGELSRAILELNLNIQKWYCFETNKDNYEQMSINAAKNSYKGEQICINKGLWEEQTVMYVSGQGTSSKVVKEADEESAVEMETIDNYFKDKHVDLIKMDIEGAETSALKGGLEVIKRDRPVLAISIYHSIEDYYEIMKILLAELKEYNYYIRHHSMVFCETVLYAIPK